MLFIPELLIERIFQLDWGREPLMVGKMQLDD